MKDKRMKTHKLMMIRLLKAIPGYRAGNVVARRIPHAERLIEMKIAEPYVVKQEKRTIQTKEEKFIPETKEYNGIKAPPVKDFSQTSIKNLGEIIGDLSEDELLNIIKVDERVSAVRLAKREIARREED
jgi:hypothetical protein